MTTAVAFAAAINCSSQGCGRCRSCVKIAGALHPDVWQVEAEGNFITLDQIREVKKDAVIKAFEAPYKAYIIDEIERMTREAANALLKVLEEPPSGVIFILVASNLDGVIETISSRCRHILFKRLKREIMVEAMIKEKKVDQNKANLAARLSQGALGRALEILGDDYELTRRENIISLIKNMDSLDELALADWVEELMESVKQQLDLLSDSHAAELAELKEAAGSPAQASAISKRFELKHKREIAKKELELFEGVLFTFSSWYRDLAALLAGADEGVLINLDQLKGVKEGLRGSSLEEVRLKLSKVIRTKQLLSSNVNKRLALEVMLFELKEAA